MAILTVAPDRRLGAQPQPGFALLRRVLIAQLCGCQVSDEAQASWFWLASDDLTAVRYGRVWGSGSVGAWVVWVRM